MKPFAIVADSCSDLPKDFRQAHGIDYVKMMLNWTEKDGTVRENIADLDWETLSSKAFYDILRGGTRIYTSQPTPQDYLDLFLPHLKKGEDVLYLACSSGLSASINTAKVLAEGVLKNDYPDHRVIVVDTLRAGMSLGMIIMDAQRLKDEGKTLDEVVDFVEKEKLHYKEIGIPETLTYLKRAGRVSGAAAVMGNLIQLKPILIWDDKGCNGVLEKAIGKKKAYATMAKYIKEDIVSPEKQDVYLMHADCSEAEIEAFKKAILSEVPVRSVIPLPLGPIIGASSGPGTIIVNYIGK